MLASGKPGDSGEAVSCTTRGAAFVARRPVHDISGLCWGYKILFHFPHGPTNPDSVYSCTAKGLLDGLPLLAGKNTDLRLIIPLPGRLAAKGAAWVLQEGRTLLELLEETAPSPRALAACREFKAQGMQIGLRYFPKLFLLDHLLELADVVSARTAGLANTDIQRLAEEKKRFDFLLLAEDLDDLQARRQAGEAGFDLFLGGEINSSAIPHNRSFSSAEMTRMRIIRELYLDEWRIEPLSRLIRADGALCYRLLAYLNSAWFSLDEPVDSITKALMLLGTNRLKHWLLLVVLADVADQTGGQEVLLRMAERGRLLELLAQRKLAPLPPESMFLLGSFSLLGELMDAPLCAVLAELPMHAAIRTAILERTGPAALWLALCESLENGHFDALEQRLRDLGFDPAHAALDHTQARQWAIHMLSP
jgi:EAL and modified HD-GYP domain-containing signal transduction protein